MSKTLNQYQAACFLGISPELLEYFTKNTVKKNDKRKLMVVSRVNNVTMFDESELRAYNDWLLLPWPADAKKRPHLPGAIKDEIKAEAGGECAICSKHGGACEAAHISPLATSKCNHPHNLLWLCSTHHTKFDNGCLGPKGVENDLVKATKLVLQHSRKFLWERTVAVSNEIAALLKLATDTTLQLRRASSQDNSALAEENGKKIIKLLTELTGNKLHNNPSTVVSKISFALVQPTTTPTNSSATTAQTLSLVATYEEDFLIEAGLKNCPLCDGRKWHGAEECPVCQGDGTVAKDFECDLSPYALLTCRHCRGDKLIDLVDCPACGGEGQLEARVDAWTDWTGFQKVVCQLCEGDGSVDKNDCPACGGEGTLSARQAELTDWASFRNIPCRLCKGSRSLDNEDCPACRGEGEMPARVADQIDWSGYQKVICPLCTGRRSWRGGDDCPFCLGEGKVNLRDAETADLSRYSDVDCPVCNGIRTYNHETCPACLGEGKMEAWRADFVDLGQYGQ